VEKIKILISPGLELWPFGRPTPTYSLPSTRINSVNPDFARTFHGSATIQWSHGSWDNIGKQSRGGQICWKMYDLSVLEISWLLLHACISGDGMMWNNFTYIIS
jgi:hypothetical protein